MRPWLVSLVPPPTQKWRDVTCPFSQGAGGEPNHPHGPPVRGLGGSVPASGPGPPPLAVCLKCQLPPRRSLHGLGPPPLGPALAAEVDNRRWGVQGALIHLIRLHGPRRGRGEPGSDTRISQANHVGFGRKMPPGTLEPVAGSEQLIPLPRIGPSRERWLLDWGSPPPASLYYLMRVCRVWGVAVLCVGWG